MRFSLPLLRPFLKERSFCAPAEYKLSPRPLGHHASPMNVVRHDKGGAFLGCRRGLGRTHLPPLGVYRSGESVPNDADSACEAR
jgi:hypothetical protein